jgi:hypothetical protein
VTSIRLGGDVKIVGLSLRETIQELSNQKVIVQSSFGISCLVVILKVGEAISHSSRRLYVEHVGAFVPTVRIFEELAVFVDVKWSMFDGKSVYTRASRSSIGPKNNRIGGRIALTFHIPIEQIAIMLLVDGEISSVLIKSRMVVQPW